MLSNLTQLRHLELANVHKSRTGGEDAASSFYDPNCAPNCLNQTTAWPSASPAFTALFASSQLQHFELDDQHLPAGALQYALTGVHCWQQLPHLTALRLGSAGRDPLDSTSVAALASRMPALQSCSMNIAADAQLASLRQMPALKSLAASVHSGSTLAEIATALTRLEVLYIHCLGVSRQDATAGISSEHLVALTALKQLRTLQFETNVWHVSLTGGRRSNCYMERHLRLKLQRQVCCMVTNLDLASLSCMARLGAC